MTEKVFNVFIDGQAGATGLRLSERLARRPEIRLITINEASRKDARARLALMAQADVSFLCLPDDSAREIAALAPADARVIDASTAHRTAAGWTYGMPELVCVDADTRRVANPGCHATGFILSVRPLVDAGILRADAALAFHSLTGYSGGGKSMIAAYEARDESTQDESARGGFSRSPRQYALAQEHKHLPEMRKYSGLETTPLFAPIVADYYSGMLVSVPLQREMMAKSASPETIREILAERYKECPLIKVRAREYAFSDGAGGGFLAADAFANRDDLEIIVTGKDDRIEIVTRYDNLGKGASGAAIQNMNLLLGLPETAGLVAGE